MPGAELGDSATVAVLVLVVLVVLTGFTESACVSSFSSQCGQLCYTADHGNLTLPTKCGPNNDQYCSRLDCYFEICPLSKPVEIAIAIWELDLESPYNCYDYIEIDGLRFCNKDVLLHSVKVDKSGCANVHFHSDSDINGKGFSLSYFSSIRDKCNAVYGDPSDSVSLPTECGGQYCPNMNCYIGICPDSSPDYVTLTFSLFDVDDNETCSGDVLEVDGTAYCSLDSVPHVFPLGQSGCLNLTFRSDSSRQGRGFRLTYQAGVEVPSCPAVYMGSKGVVYFPQPPYDVDPNCSMKVCLGPKAQKVTLTARQWDMSCPDDFLETGGRRYCQASPQGEVLPLDGRGCLDLLFHRNSLRADVELFYSLFSPDCGQLYYSDVSGIVTLPTACDGLYCNNLRCNYSVCIPDMLDKPFLVDFTVFMMDLEGGQACRGDYLLINDVCFYTTYSIYSPNCFSMSFRSDEKIGGKGFSMLYAGRSMQCGVLKHLEDSGRIELIGCDPTYCSIRQCRSTICPMSRPSHVKVQLAYLMVGEGNCSTDFLELNGIRKCSFTDQPMVIPVDAHGCLEIGFSFSTHSSALGLYYEAVASFPESTTSHPVLSSMAPNTTAQPVSPVRCTPLPYNATTLAGPSSSTAPAIPSPSRTSAAAIPSSSPTSAAAKPPTAGHSRTATGSEEGGPARQEVGQTQGSPGKGPGLLGVQWAGVGFVLCLGVEGLALAAVCLFRHFRRPRQEDDMVIINESSV